MVARAIGFRKFGVSRAINIGKCYLLNMDKIRRTSSDEATSSIIDELLTDRGFGNREFDRATHGAITYSRIRDIRSGLRGPIRLSEFLIICQTCDVDPVVTLREIITEAHHLEEEQTRTRGFVVTDEAISRIAAHPEEYDMAANQDKNKELERDTPRE
ncbi:hypothetical protein [Bifidobacterium moukalabense]|uniref:hypothetical protein n=1 Tax=Bifidobacterium moukalabense TaxID=1333651 RepID=UPI0010F8EE0F|nr:hypothetical protein [Bifidobacterium moukalabense]